MNKRKIIFIILIIIVILNLFLSIKLILKEQIIIKVNDENKKIIYEAFDKKVDNVNKIRKVGVGQGWHSGELYVYYSFGETETLLITEGMNYGEIPIDSYIRENGYSLDKIGLILTGISVLIIIHLIIIIKKMKRGNLYEKISKD